LAETLTLNKADFIRSGTRGATFLAYRKAIQEVVGRQLKEWGTEAKLASPRGRRTRPLERDLQSVLLGLSREFPLLAALVERRRGGQKRLPLGGSPVTASRWPRGPEPGKETEHEAGPSSEEAGEVGKEHGEPSNSEREREATESVLDATVDQSPHAGRRRARTSGHYGLRIRFEERPDDPELGRLIESTVWVNASHPAYLRAVSSRYEGYHLALTVAMTLASLAVEPERAHAFVTSFMARWGEASRG
jgi:hypothetical protein